MYLCAFVSLYMHGRAHLHMFVNALFYIFKTLKMWFRYARFCVSIIAVSYTHLSLWSGVCVINRVTKPSESESVWIVPLRGTYKRLHVASKMTDIQKVKTVYILIEKIKIKNIKIIFWIGHHCLFHDNFYNRRRVKTSPMKAIRLPMK